MRSGGPSAVQRVRRDVWPDGCDLGLVPVAPRRRAVCGRGLHHCCVLVYRIHLIRQSCGHPCPALTDTFAGIRPVTCQDSSPARCWVRWSRRCFFGGWCRLSSRGRDAVLLRRGSKGCMKTVVFACVHNCRAVADGRGALQPLRPTLRRRAPSLPGPNPGDRVHPEVVTVMREVGIDLTPSFRPRKLTTELAAGAQMLITMGCRRRVLRSCPGRQERRSDPKETATGRERR